MMLSFFINVFLGESYLMKKRYASIIISIITFLLICIIFWYLTQLCREKDDFGKNGQLVTSEPGTFDVLLAGSSHMAVIQPIWLWEDCGITSYNIFTRGDGMDRSLASLKLALDYQDPKLVVIDTDAWWRNGSFEKSPGDFHQTFNYYPLSLNKANIIAEMFPDNPAAQIELLFDFLRYHNRIQGLKRSDFKYDEDTCLGAHLRITGYPQIEYDRIDPDEVADYEPEQLKVLKEAIELCQSRGIDVLLICLPFSAESTDQAFQHVVNSIAEQYNVPFYNFLDHDSLIDYRTDLKDRGHLNMSGAAKLMPVLEEQILKSSKLTDHRNESETAAWWEERRKDYHKGIVDYMNQPELITYDGL